MPEELHHVGHVGEAVVLGGLGGPPLDARAVDLDRTAAAAADEVVVVTRSALAEEGLAVVGAQGVDLAGLGHRLERAVDGRQANIDASNDHFIVKNARARPSPQLCSATRATETTSSSAPTLNTFTPPADRERFLHYVYW